MNSISVAFIVALLHTVTAQRIPPTITYISPQQIKDVGETVELECSVQNAQEYPILWIKINGPSDQVVISSQQSLILPDSRFSLRYNKASSTYALKIKDIEISDEGAYQCQVMISISHKISADAELRVSSSPIISNISTTSATVVEGDTAKLECYAEGTPTPKITWRRENNAILTTGGAIYQGSILKISNVQKEDRGIYYCTAENGKGREARRNITLNVEFPPVVMAERPKIGQAPQYAADLGCRVEAYPSPNITWYKNDVDISNDYRYRVSSKITADKYIDSTIHIDTVQPEQYGLYICKAANKLGSADTTVQLFEISTPNL